MPSLYLPPEFFHSGERIIADEKAKYLLNVLRIKSGDRIKLFDGLGNRYIAECHPCKSTTVSLELVAQETVKSESPLSLILAQGMGKGKKMDFVIQKATELGVKKIIPLITQRTLIKETTKLMRWKKIALSAAQQSDRAIVPEIHAPMTLKTFFNHGFRGILFWEMEKNRGLKDLLRQRAFKKEIVLLIGPEGGFTGHEVAMATERNFKPASLGPRILRTETAAITALSILQYELGDLSEWDRRKMER